MDFVRSKIMVFCGEVHIPSGTLLNQFILSNTASDELVIITDSVY